MTCPTESHRDEPRQDSGPGRWRRRVATSGAALERFESDGMDLTTAGLTRRNVIVFTRNCR